MNTKMQIYLLAIASFFFLLSLTIELVYILIPVAIVWTGVLLYRAYNADIPTTSPTKKRTDAPSYLFVNKIEYLKSAEWQTLRKSTLKRDNYACQSCGATGVPLEVHHLTYQRLGKERPSDVISLCRVCHERQHQHYGFDYSTDYSNIV
jgi:hypothetical protein